MGIVNFDDWLKLIRKDLLRCYGSFMTENDVDELINENIDVIDDDYKCNLKDFKEQTDCKDMATWISGIVGCLRLLW